MMRGGDRGDSILDPIPRTLSVQYGTSTRMDVKGKGGGGRE